MWTIKIDGAERARLECTEYAAYARAEEAAAANPLKRVGLFSDDPRDDAWYACMADAEGEVEGIIP